MLQLKNISKHFGGLQVLQDVNFNVPQGGIYGLIGPNGAGKTTVFNLITGLLQPSGGNILFEGREHEILLGRGHLSECAETGDQRCEQRARPVQVAGCRQVLGHTTLPAGGPLIRRHDPVDGGPEGGTCEQRVVSGRQATHRCHRR